MGEIMGEYQQTYCDRCEDAWRKLATLLFKKKAVQQHLAHPLWYVDETGDCPICNAIVALDAKAGTDGRAR